MQPVITSPPPAGSGALRALLRRSLNAPNVVTFTRLVLAIVLFGMIDHGDLWISSAILFVVAASTDFLDGYLARKWGQVTVLGRICDPFVDKIIVCGAFLFLQSWPASGVTAWITFVIIAREMFVTTLRAFLEQQGRDFSAQWIGKIKMVVQCAAVPVCMLALSPQFLAALPEGFGPDRYATFRDLVLYATVGITFYSGVEYTFRAFRMVAAER